MELHVSLNERTNLSSEIYRQLRQSILDGRLQAGDRLPPTRDLAHRLSVARNTVTVAYEQLWSEGLVTSRVGAGTFISSAVAAAQYPARSDGVGSSLSPRNMWASVSVPTPFLHNPHHRFNFVTGIPDATLFPHKAWRRLMGEQLRAEPAFGHYGAPAGYSRLREAIARHVGISRAVQAAPDNVVIATGTQQALDIIARVLLEPGDHVAVEDPGYPPARMVFESLGCRVHGIAVDREGIVVQAMPPETRLIYVTPSHQCPLGMAMSLPRRLALLAWASRHGAAIVEDDYDSEFRYGGRPIEPLYTLDAHGRVIYVGSFSKTLSPSLRLGFIVTPPSLRNAMQKAKFVSDGHTALHTQAALASFIDQGGYARHLRRLRAIYEQRHDLMTRVLVRDFAELVDVLPSAAGLHIAARTPSASIEQITQVANQSRAMGVAFHHLSGFAYQQPAQAGILLGYGAVPTSNIEEGLSRLRLCFQQVLGR
jgi:GntR family transcriptional regulator / MocR family aminotransferase